MRIWKPSGTYPVEIMVTCLRETPPSGVVDTPQAMRDYIVTTITTRPDFNGDVENFYVLYLNARVRVTGHTMVARGTLDGVLASPREIFRGAIVANAAAIVVCHNHPSGDPTPSALDIAITSQLISAGKLLGINLTDHIIIGAADGQRTKDFTNLREFGYFQ